MPYVSNTAKDVDAMLEAIGVSSIDELFDRQIPKELQLGRALNLPPAMSEIELTSHLSQLSDKNDNASSSLCFLGGGAYDHFIPAAVDSIASRGEFVTSYTPYQPEVSQGNLQAIFEYQTMVCQLTGLDVSNASLYDGGSASVEAVMMCLNATRRTGKVVVVESLHPEYRDIIKTYMLNLGVEVQTVAAPQGTFDADALAAAIDDQTACVVIQHPNFFGCLEDIETATELAHQKGALLVQVFDPISLGILKRPGDYGVDVAVAEGQSLGNALAYGGPYLGIMACTEKLMRKMPGRIAGQTTANSDRRAWVLTLQTREQHIRREKATSNICTNQGLLALRSSIYMALMGPQGMKEVAELSLRKANYACQQLSGLGRFEKAFDSPIFKEFVIRDKDGDVENLLQRAANEGIMAGIWLGKWYPDLSDSFLVAVTEKRTKSEIDRLAACLQNSTTEVETIHA